MGCKKYFEKIAPFVDGELEETTSLEIEKHIDECLMCQKEYTSIKKIDFLYREASLNFYTEGFTDIVMKKIHNKKYKFKRTISKMIASILLVAIGAFSGYFIHYNHSQLPIEKVTEVKKRFPYMIKINNSKDYSVVIENETDEKNWHIFIKNYTDKINEELKESKLNKYKVESIPVKLVDYGDF